MLDALSYLGVVLGVLSIFVSFCAHALLGHHSTRDRGIVVLRWTFAVFAVASVLLVSYLVLHVAEQVRHG